MQGGRGDNLVRVGMLHRAWMDSMLNRTEACECVYLLLIKVHEAPSPSPEKNKETGRIICTRWPQINLSDTRITRKSPAALRSLLRLSLLSDSLIIVSQISFKACQNFDYLPLSLISPRRATMCWTTLKSRLLLFQRHFEVL